MITVTRPDGATVRWFADDVRLVTARDGACHIEAPGLPDVPVRAEDVLAAERSLYSFVTTEVWKAQQAAEQQRQDRADEEVRARLVAMALGVAA